MKRDPSDEWLLHRWLNDLVLWGLLGWLVGLLVVLLLTVFLPWGTPLWLALWVGVVWPGAAEAVLVGIGAWKVAAFLGWMGNLRWYRHRGSVWPALAALEAVRRPALWEEVDQAVRDRRVLGPGHLFAMALQAWHAGRPVEARDLMHLVLYVDTSLQTRPLPRWATEWLVCEALERGDVGAAEGWRRHPRAAWSLRCSLAVAAVQGGAGPGVWGMWAFAGAWWRTRSLVEQARRPRPTEPVPWPSSPVVALWVAERTGAPDAVRHAVATWQEHLPALRPRVAARLAELGGVGVAPSVREEVEQALADLVQRHRVALGADEGGLVRARVLGDLRDAARALADELQRRSDERDPLPMADEVVAWCRVLRAYDDIVCIGGEVQRSQAYGIVHSALNNHAVWLHNRRGNQIVANALYRRAWHAAVQADHPGQELLYSNVDCGPGDGSPRRYF